jgi:hypothetical protein
MAIDCQVGADQSILVNAGSSLTMGAEGDLEQSGSEVETERAGFSDVSVTIDGVAVPDLDAYWVVSPPFQLSFGEDNLFGLEPGSGSNAVSGGWFVMVPPLEPGTHTIVLHSEATVGDADDEAPSVAQRTATIMVSASDQAAAQHPAPNVSRTPDRVAQWPDTSGAT